MKGEALHMAENTCEALHRQRKGGMKGRRGLDSPSYLAFPISPRDFPLPFPFLLKVSLPLFDFRLSNFFNRSGCVSHFGEENTSSKEAVPTTRRYPGDLFFPQGPWQRARSSRRNPLFLPPAPQERSRLCPSPCSTHSSGAGEPCPHTLCAKVPAATHRRAGSSRKIPPSRLEALQLGCGCKRRRASDSAGKEEKNPGRGKKGKEKSAFKHTSPNWEGL